MNRFGIEQMSAKKLLGHENMLEDVGTTRGPRMTSRADHDIPRLVPGVLIVKRSSRALCTL
jgi:hypothetical protein